MIYLVGTISSTTRPALDDRRIGILTTPHRYRIIDPRWVWAADNGCFGKAYVGDAAWFAWLERMSEQGGTCLFATAPDVVADHAATMRRSLPWLERIRGQGLAAGFVVQDGANVGNLPWDAFDVVFVGGSTTWKLGSEAEAIIRSALDRGRHVHVGRVNSWRRYVRFAQMGVQSADGNYVAFGPDRNLPRVLSWGKRFQAEPTLFQSVH